MILRFPAEWEKHEATWFTFPHSEEETFPEALADVQKIYCQFIPEVAQGEDVHLLVQPQQVDFVLQALGHVENLYLHGFATESEWIRDYGGIVVYETVDGITERLVLDWIFNNWGGKYGAAPANNEVPGIMADAHEMAHEELDVVLEGGSIDSNGEGVILTTTACLLNKNRNPHYNQAAIEEILKEAFGAKQIIWLNDGIVGDDTDGHIDDITRFVAPDTVVTVVETNRNSPNFAPLQENLRILANTTLWNGKPLKVIPLPCPKPQFFNAEMLPASYANFYIANTCVLVPQFKDEQDEKALKILQECFPNRKIVGVDCTKIIRGLGALHCLSQQVPA